MKKSEYGGYIDSALATFASGWAADLANLNRAVDVEILADEVVVATVGHEQRIRINANSCTDPVAYFQNIGGS